MSIELVEKYDTSKIKNIFQSPVLKTWTYGDQRRLYKLFELINDTENLTVEYKISNSFNVGRYKFDVKDHKKEAPYTYCSLPREIRAVLADKYYYDIDIVNCHPVIFEQLCKKYNLNCPVLSTYVRKREEVLNKLIEKGVSRDLAKQLFLVIQYNGSIEKWKKDNKIDIHINKFVYEFQRELKENATELLKNKDFDYIHKYYATEYERDRQYENELGTKLSLICQTIEREIITELLDIIQSDNYTVGAIIYDGLHIEKNDEEITQDVMDDWCKRLYRKLHYKISLSCKRFDTKNIYNTDLNVFNVDVYNRYDPDYFKNTLDYPTLKAAFEKIACKIINQNVYVVYDDTGSRLIMSLKELRERYLHLSFINSKFEEKPFIDEWVRDKDIRWYRSIEIIFPNIHNKPIHDDRVFNTWCGFECEKNNTETYDPSCENLKFIRKIFKDILGDCFDYIEYWIADLLQNTNVKPHGAALVLYSEIEGVGKNSLFELLKTIIGGQYCLETDRPDLTLYGRFTKQRENKLLICLDETTAKVSYAYCEQIKSMLTETTFVCEEKGKTSYTANCYERFIFTTNNSLSLNISSSDRRFVVVECNPLYVNNKDIFKRFYGLLKDKKTMFNVLSYYKNKSIDIDITHDKPVSSLKKRIMEANTPPIKKWFHEFIENFDEEIDAKTKYTSMSLFKKYLSWLGENNFKTLAQSLTSKRFGMDIKAFYDQTSSSYIRGIINTTPDRNGVSLVFDKPLILSQIKDW